MSPWGTGGDPLAFAMLFVALPFFVLLILAAWGFPLPLVLADGLLAVWAITPRDYANSLEGPVGPVIAGCALVSAVLAWDLRKRDVGRTTRFPPIRP